MYHSYHGGHDVINPRTYFKTLKTEMSFTSVFLLMEFEFLISFPIQTLWLLLLLILQKLNSQIVKLRTPRQIVLKL